jgi:hypothetical protein
MQNPLEGHEPVSEDDCVPETDLEVLRICARAHGARRGAMWYDWGEGRMRGDGMNGPVSEDSCVVCAEWPDEHRAYLRWFIASVPVRDLDQICDECLLAFWDNFAHRPRPDGFIFPDIYATPPLPPRRR